jgi:hypothetical protein
MMVIVLEGFENDSDLVGASLARADVQRVLRPETNLAIHPDVEAALRDGGIAVQAGDRDGGGPLTGSGGPALVTQER